MVPVIGIDSMVTHAHFRNTQGYMTLGMCSLIKPDAMEKYMPFPDQIYTVML